MFIALIDRMSTWQKFIMTAQFQQIIHIKQKLMLDCNTMTQIKFLLIKQIMDTPEISLNQIIPETMQKCC